MGRGEKTRIHKRSCPRDFSVPPREFSSPREISFYREFSLCNGYILGVHGYQFLL